MLSAKPIESYTHHSSLTDLILSTSSSILGKAKKYVLS